MKAYVSMRILPLISLFFLAFLLRTSLTSAAETPTLSDDDLLHLAGNKYASGELPLGDKHYTLDGPRIGYIYLCHLMSDGAGGAGRAGPWIHGTTWNIYQKLSVQGHIAWKDAYFSHQLNGDGRTIEGNGLPINHATGIFPIEPSDPAYSYDRNPNSIEAQPIRETLPSNPTYGNPHCMGMEVGYMLNGVPLFNGFDAGLRDAAAHEIQDSCQGHPQIKGMYHYHSLSSCVGSTSVKTVIGYALDGFPITGPQVAPEKYLTTADLDVCHGIRSEFVEDGLHKLGYHYVMTMDFPYSVSCFRGTPIRTGPLHTPGSDENGQEDIRQQNQPPTLQTAGHRGPPPEAIDACQAIGEMTPCGFMSPRGDHVQGICRMTPENTLACVPSH